LSSTQLAPMNLHVPLNLQYEYHSAPTNFSLAPKSNPLLILTLTVV